MYRPGPRELRVTASASTIQFTSISGYWCSSSGSGNNGPLPTAKSVNLKAWWYKHVMHWLRPETEEIPPPLEQLPITPARERRQFLAEAQDNIRHRERVLRMLEAKAKAQTGLFKEQT